MIRVLIAEDERLAREELSYYLLQEEDIELLPFAVNGRELLEKVESYEPDVIFLDIKMPEMEGIQAARMLSSRKQQPLIVFCTAYENYALDAFSLYAVDYLLKPTEPHRLKETLQRLRKRLQESKQGENQRESSPSSGTAAKVAKLLIEEQNRFVVLEPESILYAVRDERVIQIHTLQETYTSKMTLQQLEEKLQSYSFFRTHRSYLVNLQYVAELVPWFNGAYNLKLKTGKHAQIPVSRSYARELLKRLEGHQG